MNLTTVFLICISAVVAVFLAWFIYSFICYARTEDPNFRTYPEQFSTWMNKAKQRIPNSLRFTKRNGKQDNQYRNTTIVLINIIQQNHDKRN